MKKLLKNIIVCTFVVILATLMSCQEEEFGYTKDDVRAGVYNRNFDKVYGPVDPNQSWDFTQYGAAISSTRAGETVFTPSSYTETFIVNSLGQKVYTYTYNKKYMVEDLGSTVDFDFNDIVFTVHHEMTVIKNASNEWVSTTKNTTASLVWICGTIPFSIKVGDTVLGNGKHAGKNGDGNGINPERDSDYSDLMNVPVTGYDPDLNNVSVTVWPYEAGLTQKEITNVNSSIGNTISFPSVGDHPYIIVCDVNTPLADENENFDISQFKEFRSNLTPGNITILSESQPLDWFIDDQKAVAFNVNDYKGYINPNFDLSKHIGEEMIINVSSPDFSSACFRTNDSSWKEVYMSYNNYVDDESQDNKNCPFPFFGDVKFTITQAMVDNGLVITGSGYSIDRISLNCKGHKEDITIDINATYYRLPLQDLINLGVTDDNQIILIIIDNPGNHSNWGDGKIRDFNSTEKFELKGPDDNPTWTFVFTFAQIKEFANGTDGIQIEVYNNCIIKVIGVAKSNYNVSISPADENGKIVISDTEYTISNPFTSSDATFGTKYIVTAVPNDGYIFDCWSDGNTNATREITINSDLNITASFRKIPEGTILLYSGNISVSGYNNNTKIELSYPDGFKALDFLKLGKNRLTIEFAVSSNFTITAIKNSNWADIYTTETHINNGNLRLSFELKEQDVVDQYGNDLFSKISILWTAHNGTITIKSVTLE